MWRPVIFLVAGSHHKREAHPVTEGMHSTVCYGMAIRIYLFSYVVLLLTSAPASFRAGRMISCMMPAVADFIGVDERQPRRALRHPSMGIDRGSFRHLGDAAAGAGPEDRGDLAAARRQPLMFSTTPDRHSEVPAERYDLRIHLGQALGCGDVTAPSVPMSWQMDGVHGSPGKSR